MDIGLTRNGRGLDRRELLRIGSFARGGLTLSQLLETQATENGRRKVKEKAVVLLFLRSSPSQTETFNPKMSAPAEIRGITSEVRTRLPECLQRRQPDRVDRQ